MGGAEKHFLGFVVEEPEGGSVIGISFKAKARTSKFRDGQALLVTSPRDVVDFNTRLTGWQAHSEYADLVVYLDRNLKPGIELIDSDSHRTLFSKLRGKSAATSDSTEADAGLNGQKPGSRSPASRGKPPSPNNDLAMKAVALVDEEFGSAKDFVGPLLHGRLYRDLQSVKQAAVAMQNAADAAMAQQRLCDLLDRAIERSQQIALRPAETTDSIHKASELVQKLQELKDQATQQPTSRNHSRSGK
jgi:hypothetical protein